MTAMPAAEAVSPLPRTRAELARITTYGIPGVTTEAVEEAIRNGVFVVVEAEENKSNKVVDNNALIGLMELLQLM
jgi:hypothetical protein